MNVVIAVCVVVFVAIEVALRRHNRRPLHPWSFHLWLRETDKVLYYAAPKPAILKPAVTPLFQDGHEVPVVDDEWSFTVEEDDALPVQTFPDVLDAADEKEMQDRLLGRF